MDREEHVTVKRVSDEAGRLQVIGVLRATYQNEKHWVSDPESQFPQGDLARDDVSWFVAKVWGRPVGVVRMFYDPPIGAYARYGFKVIDPSIRVEDFIDRPGLAEIGRFAVLPGNRRQILVAAALMRAATIEGVERGCTHLLTDVFEDDPHSPYGFHTRVLGFRPVATHDVGELNSHSRRITLLLDLSASYKRLRNRGNWFYRYLTSAWPETLHQKLAA
ncbi:MAG: GNAT family N-acetyltransferase [Bauldia sp.]